MAGIETPKTMQLFMKCQIVNKLKPDLPQQNLDRPGKTARSLQLRSFTR